MGCSLWGRKELDMTEQLTLSLFCSSCAAEPTSSPLVEIDKVKQCPEGQLFLD